MANGLVREGKLAELHHSTFLSGWWFGTLIHINFIFPYIGKNHPNNQRGRSTTNQSLFILFECN
jgi:hypothetical protein